MIKKVLLLLTICFYGTNAQKSPHGNIKISCEVCHTTDSWKMRIKSTFNHDSTGFTLTGQHKILKCKSCHPKLVFTKKTSECTSCHTDVHRSELGQNCLRCHNMNSWIISDIKERHQQSRFPLFGKHAIANCESCHERASTHKYAGTPITCISCHRQEYLASINPNHVQAKFSTDCIQCHQVTTLTWGTSFDHNLTAFPLTGAHQVIGCQPCHINNIFQIKYSGCYQCHQTNFQNANNPSHVTGNFSNDCTLCHSTSAWSPATFNHSATKFPLTGSHIAVQCNSCHVSGNYQLAYTDCYQCHQTNFQNVTDPNHANGNFSHDCMQCHTTTSWSPSTFNHSTTRFALTGAHTSTKCQQCHIGGNYQLVYTDCYQCHQTNFQNSTNPSHVAGNFSHDCKLCHSTSAWSPATFDHNTTHFALTGAHTSTKCQQCHVSGNYQLQYTDCYQCHTTQYQQVTNPNHVTQQFAHDCTPCHSTSVWKPNTMNHDTKYFKIYSGKHKGRWTQCSQCHTTIGNLAAFSCTTGCHQSAHHQGENCYSCHRNI